ncbi:MAG: UDP-3-O-acylglucosamine N-acyltransferase [Chlamydiae bacterium]|nr:UDP-3-O-acylglucosamine N-acyltransferase [Chlamydiota bacterium]
MNKVLTLEDVAYKTSSKLIGDPKTLISGVDALDTATPNDISFLTFFLGKLNYLNQMKQSNAGAVFIPKELNIELDSNRNYLVTDNPTKAFQEMLAYFHGEKKRSYFPNIHKTTTIHPTAQVEDDVNIGPNCIIDAHVVIKKGTTIHGNTTIFAHCQIGLDCQIFSNVTLREGSILHDRVIIQPGAVIGSCGFGYTQNEKGEHIKLEQMGIVEIEEDVEIGANTTIDRSRFKKTLIKKGTKIDNLVQIAHSVEIGPYNILVSQVGIAGSTKTGHHVMFGGQAAAVGHLEICAQSLIAARGAVAKSITKPGKYAGTPATDMNLWHRQIVTQKKLPSILKELKERIQKLESQLSENKSLSS